MADDGEAAPRTVTWGVCLRRQTPSSQATGKVQICKMTQSIVVDLKNL